MQVFRQAYTRQTPFSRRVVGQLQTPSRPCWRSIASSQRRHSSITKSHGVNPLIVGCGGRSQCTEASQPKFSQQKGQSATAEKASQQKGQPAAAEEMDSDEVAIDLRERAAFLGVRLTAEEAELMAKEATQNNQDIHVTRKKFLRFAHQRMDKDIEREVLLEAIEQPDKERSIVGEHLLPAINVIGTVSFAIAGTQVAGDAGMNVIGCGFVACVTTLGGGTVNSLLFGAAKKGVPWVVDPQHLFIALLTSLITFVAWPEICRIKAEERLLELNHAAASFSIWYEGRNFLPRLSVTSCETVSKAQFIMACRDQQLYESAAAALAPNAATPPTPEALFNILDTDGDGTLRLKELQRMVQLEYDGSKLHYMLDTVALGAASVTAAATAISRGLHPVVCVVAGVTICFGGIIRDLMCRRNVTLCSQSYAAGTAAGAFVYVSLRELCLRGVPGLPLALRVVLSSGTTVGVRLIDYYREDDLLPPMHGRGQK
eukprot:6197293-Pleurochrysis_carterae.AAC.5